MNDASTQTYALGNSDGEHDRLTRQAQRFRELTEALLRSAGVGAGMRLLDLGSGVGDVAMLAATLTGPSGEVVGVERDSRSVARARERAAEAGFANIRFVEGDIAGIGETQPFDAAVGRFILQFVPEPARVLRSLHALLRPGGIVAFQEVTWRPARAANSHLPLWSACADTAHDAMVAAGANTDIGLALHRVFTEAGLPPPRLKLEMQMGALREHILWPLDLLRSVRAGNGGGPLPAELGDFATLAQRLQDEAAAANAAVTSVGVVSAWTRLAEPDLPADARLH